MITSAIDKVVHFCPGTIAEDEDVSLDGLDAPSLFNVARHLRVNPFG